MHPARFTSTILVCPGKTVSSGYFPRAKEKGGDVIDKLSFLIGF